VRLHFWRGEWWYWDDGHYYALDEDDVTAKVAASIKREFDRNPNARDQRGLVFHVTRGLVGNVVQALMSHTLIDAEIEQPAILGTSETARSFFAFTNGIIDLDQLVEHPDDPPRPLRHTPNWFSPVRFGYAYDPAATCPRWLAFLDQMLESDRERLDLLQEIFGYCLTFDTSRQKFFVCEGEGSNGKSVVLNVLTALVDPSNVSNVALEVFGERFQLTPTLGKLVNIASETDRLARVAEGTLKQFTGGDRMLFDRKNLSPVQAYPTARLVIATNNRPAFADRSEGLWRRMILIPFRVRIPDSAQDPQLADKLKTELPGIFNWAVEGLRRLKRHDRFTIPALSAEALAEYKAQSNPARVFLTETCVADPKGEVICALLYRQYADWCQTNGYDALNSAELGGEVRRAFPGTERKRGQRQPGGGRPPSYRGIRFAGDGTVEPPMPTTDELPRLITELLPDNTENAWTIDQLAKSAGTVRQIAEAVVKKLVTAGTVKCCGTGTAADPARYWVDRVVAKAA
jgi:P4 family phage/plasmid primase-like protien